MVVGTVDKGGSTPDENQQDSKDDCHQQGLDGSRLLDADKVYDQQADTYQESQCQFVDVGEQPEIETKPVESKRRLENEREPDTDPGNSSHHGAHRHVDIEIGTTGPRHGRRHF